MKTLSLIAPPIRAIHPEKWQPTGADMSAIYNYLRETVADLAEEIGDDASTTEAVKLLYDFSTLPFEKVQSDIIEHFADCFHAVGGDIERCYKDDELLRLIRIVLNPDPMKGSANP